MVGQHAAPYCVHTPWRRGPPQSPVDPGLTCAHGLGQGGAPAGPPALGRQRYLPIVCAWCHQLIRWKRGEQAGWGQVSHSLLRLLCLRVSGAGTSACEAPVVPAEGLPSCPAWTPGSPLGGKTGGVRVVGCCLLVAAVARLVLADAADMLGSQDRSS
jgi:hypothetical protein